MTDWISTLRHHRALAEQMARDIPKTLSEPGIALEQATRLYQALEQQAEFMELLSRKLEESGFDFDIVSAAERLEDKFGQLAAEAAEKIRDLRSAGAAGGPPPKS